MANVAYKEGKNHSYPRMMDERNTQEYVASLVALVEENEDAQFENIAVVLFQNDRFKYPSLFDGGITLRFVDGKVVTEIQRYVLRGIVALGGGDHAISFDIESTNDMLAYKKLLPALKDNVFLCNADHTDIPYYPRHDETYDLKHEIGSLVETSREFSRYSSLEQIVGDIRLTDFHRRIFAAAVCKLLRGSFSILDRERMWDDTTMFACVSSSLLMGRNDSKLIRSFCCENNYPLIYEPDYHSTEDELFVPLVYRCKEYRRILEKLILGYKFGEKILGRWKAEKTFYDYRTKEDIVNDIRDEGWDSCVEALEAGIPLRDVLI